MGLILSVVIITKNEARNIGWCLDSVTAATKDFPGAEIIVVDSRSSDKTVEIASRYNVKIAVIAEKHKTTPGLGRLIGKELAGGELIFFIDGDMVLMAGWLQNAVNLIKNNESVAGVTGNIEEGIMAGNGEFSPLPALSFFRNQYKGSIALASSMSGTGLFKKAVLDKIGGHNPLLRVGEDVDLFFRLTKVGFLVAWLPEIMCRHLREEKEADESLKRLSIHCVGVGRLLRIAARNRAVFKHQNFFELHLKYLAGSMLGLYLFLLSLYIHNSVLFLGWCVVVGMGSIVDAGINTMRNFLKVKVFGLFLVDIFFARLFKIIISSFGLILGFLLPLAKAQNEKWDYLIVKDNIIP